MSGVRSVESQVAGSSGQLYTKKWIPENTGVRISVPIILLHDSLGCVALWRDFPERLARASGREVIAYDRLGFGRSSAHPSRLALDFIATESVGDFSAVLDFHRVGDFIVLGHSVGGAMATHCAVNYDERCRALVTMSAQAFVEDMTLHGIQEAERAFEDPDQMARLHKYHGDKAAWVLSAWTKTWLSPDFKDWNLFKTLPQVKCPNMAIHGQDDEYGSKRHPNYFCDLSPQESVLELIEGCGHVPHREMPEKATKLIADFVESI